jgi:hypothetical protein
MASQECQKIVQMKPHRFSINPSFNCSADGASVNFINIFTTIWIEGFLWGFGTAIGNCLHILWLNQLQ